MKDLSDKIYWQSRVSRWKAQGIKITVEEYVKMFIQQDGRCKICQRQFPSLCVDHNHNTSQVRGLLCFGCNRNLNDVEFRAFWLVRQLLYLIEKDEQFKIYGEKFSRTN